jgi:Zinc finger, C2H2 type
MINARPPPLTTAGNFTAAKSNDAQQQQQQQQQQQNILIQHFQQQHKPPIVVSSPKIRVNPNTQNPTTSQVSNVLQQLQNDTFNNNNNNNNNNPQMTSLLENKTTAATNSNGLMSALQLTAVSSNATNSIHNLLNSPARMQWLVMPAGSSTPNNGAASTPSKPQQELMQSIGLVNVNATPKLATMEANTSPASSLRPPMRRRVRRKGSSPDDQAEQLTEMSVRGLNLFRYASICDGVYQCTECLKDNVQKTFKNKYSFQRHAFLYHEGTQRKVFPCPLCGKEFSRPDKMKNHMKTTHEGYMAKEFPLAGMPGDTNPTTGQPSTSPNKPKGGENKPLHLQPHQIISSESIYTLAQTQIQLQQIQAHLQIQQQKQGHPFGMMAPDQTPPKQENSTPPSPNGQQQQQHRPSPIESPLLVPKSEDLTIDLDDGQSSSPLPFNVDDLQPPTLLQTEQENVA